MPTQLFELILHPVRLRIITAISNNQVTASDLKEVLREIPQTTLYRHINILLEGGLLEVVDEIPQRGTVERVLGFKTYPSLTKEDLTGLSIEEYQQTFSLILFNLMQEAMNSLNNFPEGEEIDLLSVGYQFSEIRLNLSDAEYKTLNQEFLKLMMTAAQNKPSSDRIQRIFSYFFIPLIDARDPDSK